MCGKQCQLVKFISSLKLGDDTRSRRVGIVYRKQIQQQLVLEPHPAWFVAGMFSAQLRPLLPNLDDVRYVSMALAFTAETLLFSFHLMGRDHLDITLHTLLIYSGYGCVIFSVLEMVYRHQLLLGVGRAFCTILMGTWFWQAGFVLYSPLKPTSSATPDNGWDHDDHSSIMMVTCVFCWHMAVIFVLSLCLALAFACWYKRQGLLPDVALVNNGYSHLMNHEEEIKNLTSNDTDEEETELTMETVGVDRAMVNNGTTVHAVS